MLKMDKEELVDYAEGIGKMLKDEISGLKKKIDEYHGEMVLIKNANDLLKEHSNKMESRVHSLEK